MLAWQIGLGLFNVVATWLLVQVRKRGLDWRLTLALWVYLAVAWVGPVIAFATYIPQLLNERPISADALLVWAIACSAVDIIIVIRWGPKFSHNKPPGSHR